MSAIAADREYNTIVIGDTAGHVRVWDVSQGISTATPEACRQSFKEVRHVAHALPGPREGCGMARGDEAC